MPGKDLTGPPGGSGPGTGRGIGRGSQGMGRMSGTRPGAGPVGNCICPACGENVIHERGVPCYNASCPKCGTRLVRE